MVFSQMGMLMMLVAFRINQQFLVASKKDAQVSTARSLAKQDAHCHHLVAGV